ncbi:MAG TPA: PAS domain S-box protein [Candidatus Eisenbacteria bacterium]|nr:PAS domain S-box protein [Candidatus Eisenbacteria bacterium]
MPPGSGGPERILDRVLRSDSLEGALADGLAVLAELSGAEAAAMLVGSETDAMREVWHPDTPALRERYRVAFLAAAQRSWGNVDGPAAATTQSDPPYTLPLVAAGRTVGVLCLARCVRLETLAEVPAAAQLVGLLAWVATAHEEAARSKSARGQYERWFKTLDEQVRVLERERQKFAAIVHQSDAEVFVTDRSPLIRWTNTLLASHPPPGPTGASWIGQSCRAVCSRFGDPDGPPECGECPVVRAVTRNEVVHHEFRRSNHAEPRTLYLSALPIKGPDGLPHEVLVMVQDLSDLQVLRKSESRYRILFERSARALIMVDPATRRIVMANPMASRMTGHRAEDLIGSPLESLHPPEEWARLAGLYRAGFEAGNLASFECRVRCRDGAEVVADASGTRQDLDGQEVAMLEFIDVTQSRRVEDALHKAEERLRSVIANAPVVLFAIDEAGTFTLSEGQGLARLGLEPGQIVGCSVFELYADHPQVLANFQRAMAGEEFTERVQVGEISFETWYAPIRDAEGRPRGVIGVSNDISQQRRLEDQLRQAQKMEAIGRLAGGVAHDFNNLLAAIMGHGELMLRRVEATNPLHRHAEAIQKAATRGALLTRQLLAFSRKEVLAQRNLDLHLLVAEMEEMLRRLIGEHIELIIVLGDRPVHVLGDRGQLEQVVMNLAVNARDAMADGGVLTIEVASVDRPGEPGASNPRSGPFVTIAVTDTGCGMDEATAARIFEPFFTTKGQGKGTGLGLSTVYGIIEQAGGWIDVASRPGTGTTFTVYLKRLEPKAGPHGTEGAPQVSVRGSETILLVEDEPAVRAMAGEALEAQGYTVLEARHGVEALAVAQKHSGPLDLLITDVVMPQMGGGELAQRLVAERPGLRVVFMSGYTDDAVIRQGVSEATSAFLQKPFAIGALARKVREVLDAPASESRAA